MFLNGPAYTAFNYNRWNFYSNTYTPTVKIDGLASSYTPSSFPGTFDSRLAVPCYTDIEVDMVGGYTGGTAYISVTAEQEPPTTPIRVWCVIVEDHEIATAAWGGYNGKEMMWIPVSFPLGSAGAVLEFTGPYPETIEVEGNYTLNPNIHPYENLNVVTYVQAITGNKEVLNANYINLAETTGLEEAEGGVPEVATLTAGPNPTTGSLAIECVLPSDVTGTVRVFDLSGRVVESFQAQNGTMDAEMSESGVYFVRLETSAGDLVTRSVTVIR